MTNAAIKAMPSLTEGAYYALRRDLLACHIKPGDKIKINEIALQLGINASAVREALARLSSEGLVQLEAQRGFRAAPVSVMDLRDLTQTRVKIETLCLEAALACGDVDWEARIVAAFHKLIHLPEFTTTNGIDEVNEVWMRAHSDFHSALVSSCDSAWLMKIRSQLFAQSERYRQLSVRFRLSAQREPYIKAQEDEHRTMMEAALSRDLKTMTDILDIHFGRTASFVETLASESGWP